MAYWCKLYNLLVPQGNIHLFSSIKMHDRMYMYYKCQLNSPTCSITVRMLFLSITATRNILTNILFIYSFICKSHSRKKVIILFNTFLFIATSAMRCYRKIVIGPFLLFQCSKTKDKRNVNFHKIHTKLT